MKNLSVYIHIPFCLSKCDYCDFPSWAGLGQSEINGYIEALGAEIRGAVNELEGYEAQTVFLGGGTPTVLEPEVLGGILDILRENCRISPGAEISAEANPGTFKDADALRILGKAGINRLSLGVQTFDDTLLKAVGRSHRGADAAKAFSMARDAGFDNINLDLMFSMPGQTLEGFKRDLEAAVKLAPEHISCYGLIVEGNTPLGKRGYEPDEDLDRAMYALAREIFLNVGYKHYEISNFALPGRYSRHNYAYWTGIEYRGFGLGAHSLINYTRFHNVYDLDAYISARGFSPRQNPEVLGEKDRMAEFLILGLRLLNGINFKDFSDKFEKNIFHEYGSPIEELVKLGLLEICDNEANQSSIRLTIKGLDLSNQVFERFI